MPAPDIIKRYAEIGAAVRLQQLDAETKAILSAFPGLSAAGAPGRKRRTMSAAARAKIAAAAKRRWAAWRKAKGKE